MHDETKADAPLTPDEERALRAAWPRTAEALRSMAHRANTARGASWEHGARCANHLLNAVGAVGHLLATLDEVRTDRDAVQRAAARELQAATRAELDAAWQATGVASTVRGLTTLADVVTTQRESAAELRRELVAGSTGRLLATLDQVRRERAELAERVAGAVARADLLRDVARHERDVYARVIARLRVALRLDAGASISDVVKRAEELAARGER